VAQKPLAQVVEVDSSNDKSAMFAQGSDTSSKTAQLTPDETRKVLTPFAFKIDQSLFGAPLAVPWRRGLALLVDLLFVAILSGAPGELLALLVAVTLFRVGSKKRAAKVGKKRGIRKAILRFIGAFIVFVVLIETLPEIFSDAANIGDDIVNDGRPSNTLVNKNTSSDTILSSDSNQLAVGLITVAATAALSQSDCKTVSCWQEQLDGLTKAYIEQGTSAQKTSEFVEAMLTSVRKTNSLDDQQYQQLQSQSLMTSKEMQAQYAGESDITASTPSLNEESSATIKALPQDIAGEPKKDSSSVYKGFDWAKGLVEDLGLGFGWAAFYFTIFTAIWAGQTPGKKLLRIRVIQLNGTPLSVWDSFGRYGGYAAGIATGLLGFMQIYWDPNRQAIHDKISATIVVDDTRLNLQVVDDQKVK
jgi:uncharacterized RDD family membrane protein YckC